VNIKLITRNGDVVLETTKEPIPPFILPPDVILWGSRVFIYSRIVERVTTMVYVEAFAYTLGDA
jgi:hypothetical protein